MSTCQGQIATWKLPPIWPLLATSHHRSTYIYWFLHGPTSGRISTQTHKLWSWAAGHSNKGSYVMYNCILLTLMTAQGSAINKTLVFLLGLYPPPSFWTGNIGDRDQHVSQTPEPHLRNCDLRSQLRATFHDSLHIWIRAIRISNLIAISAPWVRKSSKNSRKLKVCKINTTWCALSREVAQGPPPSNFRLQ